MTTELLSTNSSHIIPLSIWAGSIVGLIIVSIIGVAIVHHYTKNNRAALSVWGRFLVNVTKKPLLFLICSYIIYASIQIIELYLPNDMSISDRLFLPYFLSLIEFISFFWLVINAITVGTSELYNWSIRNNNTTLPHIIAAISSSLKSAIILLMINIVIPTLSISPNAAIALEKLSKVLFIATLGWIFVQIVNVFERIINNQYIVNNINYLSARKIQTQVTLLKRIIFVITGIVTLAGILMVFDSVKNLGAGLLTTAGVISAIGAFASQQSLSRVFAGLQLAFTQPIRIGDTVIVENEFGVVDEITLSYVVIKLWDLRNLILPTDYFTNKGILNLSRNSAQLIGSVFLYTDYTLPIDDVRQKAEEIIAGSALWNKKVKAFQVTDMKEYTMEIRVLVSAENSGDLFNLRCFVREELIKYIVREFPGSLSKTSCLR